jgi:putative transposase
MPNLRHFDGHGDVRFVTFTCFRRHKYLTTEIARNTMLEALTYLRTQRDIHIFGWILMPDHVHLVLHPPNTVRLGKAIGELKRWTSRQILHRLPSTLQVVFRINGQSAVWQRRCYDYNCRTVESVIEKIEYCHKNPVRSGFVTTPDQWVWSSYNWYQGSGKIVLEIDGLRP